MPTKVGTLGRAAEYLRGKVPRLGMFSTLDEAIRQAPMEQAPAQEWAGYLKPGRTVEREGMQFPLKKAEMEETGLARRLQEMAARGESIAKPELETLLQETRPELGRTLGTQDFIPGRTVTDNPYMHELAPDDPEFPEGSPERLRYRMLDRIRPIKYSEEGSLSHKSPGSKVYEDVTTMSDLGYQQPHFEDDTVSWSRASTHEFPETGKVRLVEEIQSDIHSTAAERTIEDPVTGKAYNPHVSRSFMMEDLGMETEDELSRLVEGRRGYQTPEVEEEIRATTVEIGRLESGVGDSAEKLEELEALDDVGDLSEAQIYELEDLEEEVGEVRDSILHLTAKRNNLLSLPPEAPFAEPKEYARVELSKQLFNAADEGENYLALTRGEDQISRYQSGMDESRKKGMHYYYDQVYPSVMKKLAKRYGAKVVDVEMPVGQTADVRLNFMHEHDLEDINDAMDMLGEFTMSGDIDEFQMGVEGAMEFGWDLDRKLADSADPRVAPLLKKVKKGEEQLDQIWKDSYNAYKTGEDEWEVLAEEQLGYDSPFHNSWENYWTNVDRLYDIWQEGATKSKGPKTFPAVEITPEVRERILKAGVPVYSAAGAGLLAGEDEELLQAQEDLDVGMAKGGDILRAAERFGKRAGRYKNPDIEVPEGYASFETEPGPGGRAYRIIGVTPDGKRRVVSTVGALGEEETGQRAAEALASAYNAGGFTDQPMQKLELSDVFSDVEPPREREYPDMSDEQFNEWLEGFERKKAARRRRLEEDEGFQKGGLARLGEAVSKPWEWLYEKTPAYEMMAHAPNVLTAGMIPVGDPGGAMERDVKLAKLLSSGLASQVMGADPTTGEPELALTPPPYITSPLDYYNATPEAREQMMEEYHQNYARPGLVDETLAIPTLMEIGGGTPPEWATEALERQDLLREKIAGEIDVEPAEGLLEHGFESLGIMAGQAPVPGQAFKSVAERLKGAGGLGQAVRYATAPVRAGIEWLSPIVEPKLVNYLIGAGFGGTIGALGDEPPAEEAGYESLEELVGAVDRGDADAEAILMEMLRDYKEQQESGEREEMAKGGKVSGILDLLRDQVKESASYLTPQEQEESLRDLVRRQKNPELEDYVGALVSRSERQSLMEPPRAKGPAAQGEAYSWGEIEQFGERDPDAMDVLDAGVPEELSSSLQRYMSEMTPEMRGWLAEKGFQLDDTGLYYDPKNRQEIDDVLNRISDEYDIAQESGVEKGIHGAGTMNVHPGELEKQPTWQKFGLYGDDDVDYNSGYIHTVLNFIDQLRGKKAPSILEGMESSPRAQELIEEGMPSFAYLSRPPTMAQSVWEKTPEYLEAHRILDRIEEQAKQEGIKDIGEAIETEYFARRK